MEGEEVEEVVSKLEAEVMVMVVFAVAEGWGVEEEAMMESRHSLKVGMFVLEVLQWKQVFK